MISPLPGATTLKPGSATFPLPGIGADIVDDAGESVEIPGGGYLVLTRPWPSMLRGIWGDPERYRETYWSRFGDRYFAGDGAKRDDDGYYWLLGRVDDVMLVSGHNISTAEVEHALVGHPAVAEAAVVGTKDDDHRPGDQRVRDPAQRQRAERRRSSPSCASTSSNTIGPIAKPKTILFTEDLPKTRSGQDHAPAAPRRRRGPGARRHHDPRRPVGRRGHQGALPRPGDRRRRVTTVRIRTRALDLARRAGRAGARSGRRHRRRALRRRQPSALPRAAPPRLGRVLRGVRRRRRHRGGQGAARPPRPAAADRAAHRAARSGSTTSPRRGCAGTRSAGTCSSCGRGVTTTYARDFKQASRVGAAPLRLRARARDRGRPPQRRDVPRRRASPASTSTPATTTDADRDSGNAGVGIEADSVTWRSGEAGTARTTTNH